MLTRPTLSTRKPIDQLTADDLVVFPIWEFATDEEDTEGQDETWVRPVDAPAIRTGLWSLSVAADFRTASGLLVPGFVGVTTADGIELGHSVLLPDAKYVFVDVRDESARSRTARALDLIESKLFPLTFTLRVRIGKEKEFREGSIG
jgi:hypothetical protein